MTPDSDDNRSFDIEWETDGTAPDKTAQVVWESAPRVGALTLDELKRIVGTQFPFYDVRFESGLFYFYCTIDDRDGVEERFNALKEALDARNVLPLLRYERGEYVLLIASKPPKPKKRSTQVHLALLIITFITTTLSGAILISGSFGEWGDLGTMFTLENIVNGAALFAIPLMAILGVHEYGHYYISKKHGVDATLPFFLPIPPNPVLPLGTLGAFISMHEPIPNKRALLEIGVSGPIAGFLIAIPVTILGLLLSAPIDMSYASGDSLIGAPLLFSVFATLTAGVPFGSTIPLDAINPMAFAGWVGLLITSINLFPIGQLDGGHIAKALFGDRFGTVSTLMVFALIAISFLGGGFWLFFILIIILMGTQHPPPLNDVSGLDTRHVYIGIAALILLVICFTPAPLIAAP